MVCGIGVDIVRISRFEMVLKRWEKRFRERVFTEKEVTSSLNKFHSAASLAARFAAKEAFMKSLGTGWKDGVRWKDIEVITDPSGRPEICLHGKVKDLFENRGLRQSHLSLSHEGDYSVAMVVLED